MLHILFDHVRAEMGGRPGSSSLRPVFRRSQGRHVTLPRAISRFPPADGNRFQLLVGGGSVGQDWHGRPQAKARCHWPNTRI